MFGDIEYRKKIQLNLIYLVLNRLHNIDCSAIYNARTYLVIQTKQSNNDNFVMLVCSLDVYR